MEPSNPGLIECLYPCTLEPLNPRTLEFGE